MKHHPSPFNTLLRRLSLITLPLLMASPLPALQGCGGGGGAAGGVAPNGGPCCKVCTGGKACGDTCIAANQVCSTPSGCACND